MTVRLPTIAFAGPIGQQISAAAAQTLTLLASNLDNLESRNPFAEELESVRQMLYDELHKTNQACGQLFDAVGDLKVSMKGESAKVSSV